MQKDGKLWWCEKGVSGETLVVLHSVMEILGLPTVSPEPALKSLARSTKSKSKNVR